MTTPSAGVYTDFQGLTQLKTAARRDDPQALRAAAEQFEALFLQTMLKEMRQTLPGDPLLGDQHQDLYQDLMDRQVAVDMARHQGLGLADMLVEQLNGSVVKRPDGDLPTADATRNQRAAGFPSRQAFVEQLWPHAQEVGQELGVKPQVLLAQAALESGWGQAVIHDAEGRNSHNLFGIKADTHWQGERVSVPSVEYEDAIAVKRRSAFRAYDSYAESFRDYAQLLQDNPRYKTALAQGQNPEGYLRGLQSAGYATDPHYADKILGLLGGEAMRYALADL